MKIKDIAIEISERVANPKTSNYEKFVGLEHYDPGVPVITRFGDSSTLDSSMKKFKANDVLVARRNVYLKRAGLAVFDGLTSGDSIVLRCINRKYERVLPYILNTKSFWDYANKFADGTMSKRLSPDKLLDFQFDINEKTIEYKSELLASYSALINQYTNIENSLEQISKVKFLQYFKSAKKIELSKICEQIRGVSYKPEDLGNNDQNHLMLLRANNILHNEINYNDVQFVNIKKISNKQLITKNDILVCASSGSKDHVGKAAQYVDDAKCTFGAFCKLLRPINTEYSYILTEFFKSDLYRDYIENLARGSNINNLKNEHFDNIEVPQFDPELYFNYKSFLDCRNVLKEKISKVKQTVSLFYNREIESLFEEE